MRIVVTGGAGFIGSHLCDRLIAEGHQIVVVDNLITGDLANLSHLMDRGDFEFIEHDVSKSISVVGEIGAVLHLASPASPNPTSPFGYPQLPIQTLKVGGLGTHNALGLARANQARFLLASTSEIYGDPQEHPQQESYWGHVDPIGPRSVYDEAKRYAEAMTMAYHRYHELDTRIVRIFNTYGPRMRLDDGRVVPNFITQALEGRPLTVYGQGTQTRSFCYIDDLVEGIYRLLMADYSEPVNLGNPTEMTIRELAELVIELSASEAGIVTLPERRDESDPDRRRPDISRARKVLDWAPAVDLRSGLERTIADFRERL